MGPRYLYLHGFASGPESAKGRAIAAHFAARGVDVARLSLRVPSFAHLRLSHMVTHTRDALGAAEDRAVLFGSSLGGLTAARAAEVDARIVALVLLAPAFRFAERWRARLGAPAFDAYRADGWIDVDDFHEQRRGRVDFEFFEDASVVDARGDGWPDLRVPTLIVHGVADDVVSIELSRAWARGKRHVRLVEVDDGHDLARSFARITAEADLFLAPFLGVGG